MTHQQINSSKRSIKLVAGFFSIGLLAASAVAQAGENALKEVAIDHTHQSMNNNYGPARNTGIKAVLSDIGSLNHLHLRLDDKNWRIKGTEFHGTSMAAAAYYTLGNSWMGISQLQLGNSSLFSKSTVAQALIYKFGDQGQGRFSVELIHNRFDNSEQLTSFKLGPTYYWGGSNPGYVSYHYSKGSKEGNENYILDGQVHLTYKLKIGLYHLNGKGAYNVLVPNATALAAQVESNQTDLRLIYDLPNNWTIQLTKGQTTINDKKNGSNVFRSHDTRIGLTKHW